MVNAFAAKTLFMPRTNLPSAIFLVLLSGLLLPLLAPAPTTSISSSPPSLIRGLAVRSLLLNLLEHSYRNHNLWPAQLPDHPNLPDLLYTPPPPTSSAVNSLYGATIVLSESLNAHPEGVWIGFADGHLQFAPDGAAIALCQDQIRIARQAALVSHTPSTQPAPLLPPADGNLSIQVLDPNSLPVSGALVGVFGAFGDLLANLPHAYFETDINSQDNTFPLISDLHGSVILPAASVFASPFRFQNQSTAPLYILDPSRSLVTLDEIHRSDFTHPVTRQFHLQPACKVTGDVSCLGLAAASHPLTTVHAIAVKPGQFSLRSLQSRSSHADFEFLLPPGDYELLINAPDCYNIASCIHIHPGQRTLKIQPDLPLNRTTSLIGLPAPELQHIKAWKNSPPLTLASLRGHPVILDFWGYWCGPCVSAMPDLVKLDQQYRSKGLVILAIHDDSVSSIAEMDQKLLPVRAKLWSNVDLPFPIALDGGGETRIPYTSISVRGATTAAYGITSYPTSLLISPDGILLGPFNPTDPHDLARLQSLLSK